ncbi:MAG: hypothetical protein K0S79_1463 [Nitrospira sp.]|nr:hypothetical protein [Nitrospira sp.]
MPIERLARVRLDARHDPVGHIREQRDIREQLDCFIRNVSNDFRSGAEHPKHAPSLIESKPGEIEQGGSPQAGVPIILHDDLRSMDETMIERSAKGHLAGSLVSLKLRVFHGHFKLHRDAIAQRILNLRGPFNPLSIGAAPHEA